ncbi:hypothetical protein NWT09_22130 [Mycolicibacterium sp. jd]|uniref:hypothetical protein n=1 Tax=unclassified Mycolicibacterium TaxID=2636767 RepID=UPI00351BB0E0
MSEADWSAFTARVRPPDLTEEYREIAATVLPPDILNDFMPYARIDAFLTDDGHIDADRLRTTLQKFFTHGSHS